MTKNTETEEIQCSASVWDAIKDTPEQAANMRIRADLMMQISAIVKEANWTQAEAAIHCGLTQPRMDDFLHGRLSSFSIDELVTIAIVIGREVHLEIKTI